MNIYRKTPAISPGLTYFRKRFLMGLYKGGLIYGGAYTWTIFGVSNKQASHKKENEHVLITRLCYIKTKLKDNVLSIVYCVL